MLPRRSSKFPWVAVLAVVALGVLLLISWPTQCPRRHNAPVVNFPSKQLTPAGSDGAGGKANDTAFSNLLTAMLTVVSSHAEHAANTGPDFWDSMGMIAGVQQEVLDFVSYADDPDINTICEVGFNAGHSAAVLLSARPKSVIHVFDLATLPFASAQINLAKRTYGDRFFFYKGDSAHLLPWFKKKGIKCDLFSIDGDHSYEGSVTDFWNALQLMAVGSRLAADDVSPDFGGVLRAWNWLISQGYIQQQHCGAHTLSSGLRRGWCMAKVVKVPNSSDTPPTGYKQPRQLPDLV